MDRSCLVVAREPLGAEHFRVRLHPPAPFAALPGQFAMVKVSEGVDPLLRRPFSLHRMHTDGSGDFEILFRAVGTGTRVLARTRQGDRLEILAPLGQGFRLGLARPILVGGGIGVAPLLFLAETALQGGLCPTLLVGGRRERDILCHNDFSCLAVPFRVATEDGSQGQTGLVTHLLEQELETSPDAAVYACGPMPMLAAVARTCDARGVACQVSLEAHMACGVGACLGCVVPGSAATHLRVCKEGPVFDAADVEW